MEVTGTVERIRAYFCRRGYKATVLIDGEEYREERFYGMDGRTVRAEAQRWLDTAIRFWQRNHKEM